MSDVEDSDIGEAAEALGEILAGVAQLDPRSADARFAVKTLKASDSRTNI